MYDVKYVELEDFVVKGIEFKFFFYGVGLFNMLMLVMDGCLVLIHDLWQFGYGWIV